MGLDKIKYVDNITKIRTYKVVNDIKEAITYLANGETIARFEFGDSMAPILKNGEYCIITPITTDNINDIKVGDAVLCEVNGYLMTHMVIAISDASANGRYFLIGNSNMELYGWTQNIFGKAIGTNICQRNDMISNF